MMYFSDESYHYIMNKFHDTNKPFNSLMRLTRNDAIFDPATGMDPDLIRTKILENDEQYSDRSHFFRKAKALEFALDNTRIDCDSRDIFPAINCTDRPVEKTLVNRWQKEVFRTIIPEVTARMDLQNKTGVSLLYPDYCHTLPIWDTIFAKGFTGVLEDIRTAKAKKAAETELTSEQKDFYEGLEVTHVAMLRFFGRIAALAETIPGCEDMAHALRVIQNGPPTTFYEALMIDLLYFLISEHMDALQVRSSGHFDRLFYPFYKKDLEQGVSEDVLKTQLAHFFLQFVAINNYYGQPVYIGGTDENGNTEVNHLSYVFLEVYDNMKIVTPKVQIKYNPKTTPKPFARKILDMIRRGHNSLVFVSEDHIRNTLRRIGIPEKDIVHADIKGCYEFLVHGGMDTEDQQLNLLKPLEFALHGGKDALTGDLVGLECKVDYPTFADLMAEYKRQLKYIIDTTMELVNTFEHYLTYMNPQPLQTGTFTKSLAMGIDPNSGSGVTNNTYMCLGAIGSIADSLTAIKKFVYDKKLFTLEELIHILDCDFEGYEAVHRMLNNDPDKYGNNLPLPDGIANEVVSFATSCINGKPNAPIRGGWWGCSTHIARGIYDHGKKTAASADGRHCGGELSKNLTPTLGKNHKGVTAAVLSVTKFDPFTIHENPALDAAFSASAVKGEDGLDAMHGVLDTFIARGGGVMQMNVVNADVLRKAQKNPEQYTDLQIRVSGWSVQFNDIKKEEQDGFIRQAETA